MPLHLIALVESNDPYLKLLQVAIKVDNGRITFSNNVINGVQIPDSVILRLKDRPAKKPTAKPTLRPTLTSGATKSVRSTRTPSPAR